MDNDYVLITEGGELFHYGKKGMEWGKRLYQREDGSLTPLGRIHYGLKDAKTRAKRKAALKKANETRAAKKLAADEAKAKEAEKKAAEEELAKKKAELLQKPTAKEIYENRHLFTYQELNAAKIRIEMERSIKALEPAPVDKGKEFTDKLIKTTDTIANVANSGSKAWNTVAKIYNSLYGNKNNASLPMIEDKVVTALDKYKNKTEWMKAENERKKAEDERKEKVKTETELLKEEAELLKAKNELAKAEQGVLDNENKRREIERTSRQHDESDAREAARKARAEAEAETAAEADRIKSEKAKLKNEQDAYQLKKDQDKFKADKKADRDAKKAAKQQAEEAKQKAKLDADEAARKANESRSLEEYESTSARTSEYSKTGGTKEYVNPNEPRGLALYNPSGSGLSTTASRGRDYANNAVNSNKTDAGIIAKIGSMTASGNKSYAEIAAQLGVSTSTVQNYSNHRDMTYELLDQYGDSIIRYD